MPNLTGNNPITVDDTYTVTGLTPGKQYLITMFGTWAGGTVTVNFLDAVSGVPHFPANNTFTENSEFILIVPSNAVEFVLTGATSPEISVSINPIS